MTCCVGKVGNRQTAVQSALSAKGLAYIEVLVLHSCFAWCIKELKDPQAVLGMSMVPSWTV